MVHDAAEVTSTAGSSRASWARVAREEARELGRLAVCASSSLLVWIVFLGLRRRTIPFGLDVLQLDWPWTVELARVGGDPARFLYRSTWIGGARFLEVTGLAPLQSIAVAMGLPASEAIVLGAVVAQTLLAFFGVLSVEALVRSWDPSRERLPFCVVVPVALAVAFTPYAGVRYFAGHLSIVSGIVAFAAPVALVLVVRSGRVPTLTSVLAAAFGVHAVVATAMQQMVLYAAIFGGVLLVGPAITAARRKPLASAVGAMALIGGVLLAMRSFSILYASATGPDAARSLGGEVLTWSVVVPGVRDWATLFTSGRALFAARGGGLFHETQVPLGLALAALVLVPWRRERGLAIAMPLGALLVIAFSMQLEPVASGLLKLVPPLRSFRVPGRGIAPFVFLATVVALAGLVSLPTPPTGQRAERRVLVLAGALTFLVALAILPGAAGEGIALASMLVFALVVRLAPAHARSLPTWVPLASFAVASIASVARLLPPKVDERRLLAAVDDVRQTIASSRGAPRNDLERIFVDHPLATGPNAFSAGGVSGPFGYWFPTRRLVDLHAALRREPRYAANHLFAPSGGPNDPATRALAMLYDVKAWLQVDETGKKTAAPLPTIGPAWFPRRWVTYEGNEALGEALLARSVGPQAMRDDALWSAADGPVPAPIDETCGSGRTCAIKTIDGGQRIELDVTSPGRCLLVLSTNWTSRHQALLTSSSAGAERSLPVVAVDGSLLGIVLPEGEGHVVVQTVLVAPAWGARLGLVGALALALSAAGSLLLRLRERGASGVGQA